MSTEIFNIDLIREKIDSQWFQENRLVVTLKESYLRKIDIYYPNSKELMFSGFLDLSDFPEIWTIILTKSLKDTVFNMSKTFIDLLALVSTLKWTGFLSKRPVFVSNPALNNLRKTFPSLKINNALAIELLHNSLLLKKINTVKPETIDVRLAFIPRVSKSENDQRKARFEYMKDPNEIIWKINVSFKFNENFKKRFDRFTALTLIDVMNLIAENVIAVSKRLISTII